MVTRTKPRTLAEPIVGVTLEPSDHESFLPLLFEVLNIDLSDSSADSVRAHIQSALEHCARRLLLGQRVSLPGHTRAALEPIAHQASELALLLDQAIQCGSGFAELRTRIETGKTELVLVPRDGSEPLWLTRMNGEGANSSK